MQRIANALQGRFEFLLYARIPAEDKDRKIFWKGRGDYQRCGMIKIGQVTVDDVKLNDDGDEDVLAGTEVGVFEMRVKFEDC